MRGAGTFWARGDNRSVVDVEGSSDAVLIGQSRRRPEAFATVFDRHYEAVRAYVSRRVGRELAEDLASQTFIVAFERRRDFRAESDSARPWLLGIATNLLRNHWRAEQRSLEVVAMLEGAAAETEPEPSGSPRVAGALATLEREQRDVLLLYAWGELSYEEIARSLQIPVGTVRSRLARARAHVQSQLSLERSPDA
jgi:RNA polymerase sigma factor (sigma-70 family)